MSGKTALFVVNTWARSATTSRCRLDSVKKRFIKYLVPNPKQEEN